MPIRCLSSQCMERLLAWRNTQGSEENWNGETLDRDFANDKLWLGRRVVAGVVNLILTKTSTVETVAYTALAVLSLIVYPCTAAPYTFFAKCLDSSIFTMLWSTETFGLNIGFKAVVTQESFYRMFKDDYEIGILRLSRLMSIPAGYVMPMICELLKSVGYAANVALGSGLSLGLPFVILIIGFKSLERLRGLLGVGPQWTREEDLVHTRSWLEQHRPGVALENFQSESISLGGIAVLSAGRREAEINANDIAVLSARLREAEINANDDDITTEGENLI